MKDSALGWLSPQGAPSALLLELNLKVGPLPASYLALLWRGNGGEVGLKVSPLMFCLDSAESALDYWQSGTYTASGVFVFGGNGGGSLLAFDLSVPGNWPVVCFDPIDPEGSLQVVAPDFEIFWHLWSTMNNMPMDTDPQQQEAASPQVFVAWSSSRYKHNQVLR